MQQPDMRGVLAVMMPVYNEERTLPHILPNVLARPEVGEVVAVDDGSVDRTPQILEEFARRDPRVRFFRLDRNRGKGSALRKAISEVRKPFAVVQDADLEYDPNDYPTLLHPLLTGRADVVFGFRRFTAHTAYSYWFVKGGQALTWACNVLYNCYISDLCSGYKMLRSDLWRRLNLTRNGFDIDAEIAAKVLRLGYRIHEVPISYYARSRAEGKKVGFRDAVTHFLTLLEDRFSARRRLFGSAFDHSYHSDRHDELSRHHPLLRSEEGPEEASEKTPEPAVGARS